MRFVVVTIALLFIILLGVLTALDIAHYGLTSVSVLAVIVLVIFTIGVLGALRERPRG